MKQLLYILYCINLLLSPTTGSGQDMNQEKMNAVKLQVLKPLGLEEQDGAASFLEERLTQAVILNGIVSATSRFVLVTSIRELSSRVTPSTPPQYVTELEVNCYIADQTEKIILQQTTFNVKGVARSTAKTYLNAIGMIQARNPKLKTLINKGKEKIIAYYQTLDEESPERANTGTKEPDTEWILKAQPQ